MADNTTNHLDLLWLEITGKCNLQCVHCYADSGPKVSHGEMTTSRWLEIIAEAGDLGVGTIIFIGGEPTLHPDIEVLLYQASLAVPKVEIYTNLTHLSPTLLKLCQKQRIDIATSYYSCDPSIQDRVAQVPSQKKVRENLQRVVEAGLNVRVGIVNVFPEQNMTATADELRTMGIVNLTVDRARRIGRGASSSQVKLVDELCGQCSRAFAAVLPSGAVAPCVFSRDLPVGNVLTSSLSEVLNAPRMIATRDLLDRAFRLRENSGGVQADGVCPPTCHPARLREAPDKPQVCPPTCTPPTPQDAPDKPQVCPPLCAPQKDVKRESPQNCPPKCAPASESAVRNRPSS